MSMPIGPLTRCFLLVSLGALAACGGDNGGPDDNQATDDAIASDQDTPDQSGPVDTDGDGYTGGADCAEGDARHWNDCGTCLDVDDDGHGEGCNQGGDCDDSAAGGTCFTGCVLGYRDTDGDGYGSGETVPHCPIAPGYAATQDDCAPTDALHWHDCGACVDLDHDGHGTNCDVGSDDCDDTASNEWVSCGACKDYDHDGAYVGCDGYLTVNGPDCNEHDPMIYQGAIELPDDGVDEDCDPATELSANDGVGIYVDSGAVGCGTNEQGSLAAPFCTLTAAVAAADAGANIFVVSGAYTMPSNIADARIFGGYNDTFTARSASVTATQLTSNAFAFGTTLSNVVLQNAAYFYTNDCDNCTALYVADGGTTRLADVQLQQTNTQSRCSTFYGAQGNSVLMRVTIQGSACDGHHAIETIDGKQAVVWASTVQAGMPSNNVQGPSAAYGGGTLIIGESALAIDGASALGIYNLGVLEIYDSIIESTSFDQVAIAIEANGTRLVVENALLSATSATSLGLAVSVEGTCAADLFASNVAANGFGATVIDVQGTGSVRVLNDVLTGTASMLASGIANPTAGGHITVRNNDITLDAGSVGCVLNSNGDCRTTVSGSGSLDDCTWAGCDGASGDFQSVNCDTAFDGELAGVCDRVDRGYDLTGLMRFPVDFLDTVRPVDVPSVGTGTWDVGRHEYVP